MCIVTLILFYINFNLTLYNDWFLDKLYWSFWLNQIVLFSLSMLLRWGLTLSQILISSLSTNNDWNRIKANRKNVVLNQISTFKLFEGRGCLFKQETGGTDIEKDWEFKIKKPFKDVMLCLHNLGVFVLRE